MTPVTDPAIIAALEGSSRPQRQPVRDPAVIGQLEYGLNLDAPDEEIRSSIGKLPPTEQGRALKLWAEHHDTRLRNAGFDPRPAMARGIPIIGSFLDEGEAAVQSATHSLTGGRLGRPYDEALEFARTRERQADAAHPFASAAGQIATGIATGGPIFGRLAPAETLAGRVLQGGTVGGVVGAVEGFGAGEGDFANRANKAQEGGTVSALVGAGLPVVASAATRGYGAVSDYINPTITRLRSGPEAAADEILARRIAAEGSSPAQKRLDLQRGQSTAIMSGGGDKASRATLPETIADTSDAMQRLTGSVYRAGGEAGNAVRQSLEARQRGAANPYGAAADDVAPGQMDRVLDTTSRALLIRTADSARQTERQIMQKQAQEGRRLYEQARQEGFRPENAFDIQPVVDGMALVAQQYPGAFRSRLLRALNLFRDESPQRMPVNTIDRFDAAKKALDDMIDTAQRQGQGNLVRELSTFKTRLIEAVHAPDAAGNPTRNLAYHEARQAWGSAAENRQAIELGRAALRDGAEISVEQFRELSKGQQQLFRIGFLESLRNALATRRPGNDVTQLFQQRRVQELMNEIIPRSNRGVFANRPERFGEVMNREQRMVQTRNAVLGNSSTAQRQGDDLALAGNTLSGMWDRFRHSPSLFNMGIEAVGAGIQRVFGYRQDVAIQLAQRLLEQDPTRRNQILRRLQSRGGADRFTRFADMMDRAMLNLAGSTAGPMQIDDQRRVGVVR